MIAIFPVHGKVLIAQVIPVHEKQLLVLAQVWAGPCGGIGVINTVHGWSANGGCRRCLTTFGHQICQNSVLGYSLESKFQAVCC